MGDLTTLTSVKAWLGLNASSKPITAITRASPGVVTCPAHGLQSNALVAFSGLIGMTQLNGQIATATVVDANTFSISIDTSAYGAWIAGGAIGADDALLQRTITGLSAGLQVVLGRTFARATYTERRNGTGKAMLAVKNSPILSVASVTVDGVAQPARSSPTGSGYTYDDDLIYLAGSCFARGVQNIQIVYDGGFDPIPEDLDQDTVEAVAFLYREKDRIGTASKAMAGETTTFLRDMPPHLMRRFAQYQRVMVPQ